MEFRWKTRRRASQFVSDRHELANQFGCSRDFIGGVVYDNTAYYSRFDLPKRDGGLRTIEPPRPALRLVQRRILDELYARVALPGFLHGGLPQRSIFTHTRSHIARFMVATLDVRKFFPSTRAAHVRPVLEAAGFREEALDDLVQLLTLRDGLPQGSPTSCLLANLAFLPADYAIGKTCRRRALTYSRFVDDIAISGDFDFSFLKGAFVHAIQSLGYQIATEKTAFRSRSQQQVITGLVVNEKLRPTRNFISKLKRDIQFCVEHGGSIFASTTGQPWSSVKASIEGRVAHLKRCDPAEGRRLRRKLYAIRWRARRVPTSTNSYPATCS